MTDISISTDETIEIIYNVSEDTSELDFLTIKKGEEEINKEDWDEYNVKNINKFTWTPPKEGNYTLNVHDEEISIEVNDVPDSGVSRWEFEQDVTDSWDANDGTLTGGSFTTTNQTGTYALSLDGTDDYVEVPYNSNLTPSELSIGVWFKTDANTGDFDKIGGKEGPRYDQSYYISLRGDKTGNPVRFNVSEDSNTLSHVESTTDVYDGDWHHVVGTLGPSNGQTIYVDGSSEATNNNENVAYDGNSTPFYWGQRPDGTQRFSGIIDDGRVYNKELTATEVSNWHSTGSIRG